MTPISTSRETGPCHLLIIPPHGLPRSAAATSLSPIFLGSTQKAVMAPAPAKDRKLNDPISIGSWTLGFGSSFGSPHRAVYKIRNDGTAACLFSRIMQRSHKGSSLEEKAGENDCLETLFFEWKRFKALTSII